LSSFTTPPKFLTPLAHDVYKALKEVPVLQLCTHTISEADDADTITFRTEPWKLCVLVWESIIYLHFWKNNPNQDEHYQYGINAPHLREEIESWHDCTDQAEAIQLAMKCIKSKYESI
jgi:hypothetical protein